MDVEPTTGVSGEVLDVDELERQWKDIIGTLSDEDREHLEKEAAGATLTQKQDMLEQVKNILAQEQEQDEGDQMYPQGNAADDDGEIDIEALETEWREIMEQLTDGDREHLEAQANGATHAEKRDILEQVKQILVEEDEAQELDTEYREQPESGDVIDVDRLNEEWEQVLGQLSEEDQESLEKEAAGATLEQKQDMLQQVKQILEEDDVDAHQDDTGIGNERDGDEFGRKERGALSLSPEQLEVEWKEMLEGLSPEDREHVEKQGTTHDEKEILIQQVRELIQEQQENKKQVSEHWEMMLQELAEEDRMHLEEQVKSARCDIQKELLNQLPEGTINIPSELTEDGANNEVNLRAVNAQWDAAIEASSAEQQQQLRETLEEEMLEVKEDLLKQVQELLEPDAQNDDDREQTRENSTDRSNQTKSLGKDEWGDQQEWDAHAEFTGDSKSSSMRTRPSRRHDENVTLAEAEEGVRYKGKELNTSQKAGSAVLTWTLVAFLLMALIGFVWFYFRQEDSKVVDDFE